MARTADSPHYSVTPTARLGKFVRWGNHLVPETVVTTMSGGGEIDGKRWPDMTFTFTVRDGAAVCTEFRVVSKPGDRPVRTPDLRFIDIDELMQLSFMQHAWDAVEAESGEPGAWAATLGEATSAGSAREVRKRVNAGYGDPVAELKQVARTYCDPMNRKAPSNNVYELLGYGSRETANRRIRAARDKGLIPPVGATDAEIDEQFKKLSQ